MLIQICSKIDPAALSGRLCTLLTMPLALRLQWFFLFFFLLSLSSSSSSSSVNPEDGAAPGHYEMYVFALEWQPAWSSENCEAALAAHLSPSAWAASHPSIHGLWPNYDSALHDGYTWPQFCARESAGENYTACEADIASEAYCFPAAAARAFNTTDGPWQTHALEYSWSSAEDCFSCHEWSKHGGFCCS